MSFQPPRKRARSPPIETAIFTVFSQSSHDFAALPRYARVKKGCDGRPPPQCFAMLPLSAVISLAMVAGLWAERSEEPIPLAELERFWHHQDCHD